MKLVDITMEMVLNKVSLIIKKQRGNELNCLCPFCDSTNKREGHLYINIHKNTFICHKCGEKGNALQLYALLTFQDTKEAYKELTKDNFSISEVKNIYKSAITKEKAIATDEQRDKVYSELLNMLTLKDRHKQDLLKRGLSNIVVKNNQYKSFDLSKTERIEVCKKLLEKGLNLEGIPGFFKHKTTGEWDFISYKGYAIPVKNLQGQIVGLQVRMEEGQDSKYRWFSSSSAGEYGTSAESRLHISGILGIYSDEIYITEGALKADVASYLSGKTFIGLAGVSSNHYELIKVLQKLKPKKVYLTFDMDLYSKKEVKENIMKIANLLKNVNVNFKILKWDRRYKGIDDYLLSRKRAS
ncbi:DUF3854 domain-containing protein [Caldicellulosiruptoraceae bacterium PP1]